MERTPKTKGYIKERSVGRREVDRIGTCIWHDQCHDTVAEIKQDCINIEVSMKSKLEWKVFALFVAGIVTFAAAFVMFVAPLVMNMATAVTRMDTNQQHMMEELSINPIKK
jgi:hypothetical protein